MAKTKRKQARKFLPGIAAWVAGLKAAGQKPTIVEIARHFGFDSLQAFCLWLAGTCLRLESETKPDGKPNEMHGTPDHTFAVALLASLKAKYGKEKPEYFAVSSGSVNAHVVENIGREAGFDPNDTEAMGKWLGEAMDFADEESDDENETA